MISNSEMLQNGLALVPIPFGQKGPKSKDWNLRSNCVIAPSQLNALKGMNIGIAHAYCTPTPTCALDIDHYKHAKAWLNMHGIDLRAMLMGVSQKQAKFRLQNTVKILTVKILTDFFYV